MSGGHFDYQQDRLGEIARTIEEDIARALKPKPAMVHEDYWVIEMRETPHSYCYYPSCLMTFPSYDEAKGFLMSHRNVTKAEPKFADIHPVKGDDALFQSVDKFMSRTQDGERIPVLYSIHHAVFDHYPDDADVLELSDPTIETMKEAYRQIRLAEIYAERVDLMMSGDDSEDTLQECIKADLKAFEEDFQAKDWTALNDEENDDD